MSSPTPKVHYWQGRPVTELTRGELLEVIDFLGEEAERQQRWAREEREMMRAFEAAKLAFQPRRRA